MIYPHEDSEKAISNYSSNLAKAIGTDELTYVAGRPLEIFKIMRQSFTYQTIHFQHEYNLLGGFSIPMFFLYLYFYLTGSKLITTMHTVLSKKEKLKGSKLKVALRKVLYFFQNRLMGYLSDKVIVHSEHFKQILIKDYKLKAKKIKVIPQAIQENIPKYDKEEIRKELKLDSNVYLVIGSLVPDHGADVIIKQANNIGKKILIVGSKKAVNDRNDKRIFDWLSHLIELNHSNKIGNVRFDVGDLPYDLWWKYFCAADLVLLPYKGGIGSGIFADAIATKTPMVCSNTPFFNNIKEKFIRIAKTDKDFPNEIKKAMENRKEMMKSFDSYDKYKLSNIVKIYQKGVYNER